jgi:hypothetical protein
MDCLREGAMDSTPGGQRVPAETCSVLLRAGQYAAPLLRTEQGKQLCEDTLALRVSAFQLLT